MVNSLVKQRRDSIEQFRAGNRNDLADANRRRSCFSSGICRRRPNRAAIAAAIEAAVTETGAAGPKDMGKVMKAVMASWRDVRTASQ